MDNKATHTDKKNVNVDADPAAIARARKAVILETSLRSLRSFELLRDDPTWKDAIESLREIDPHLAELCAAADIAALEPLRHIVSYLKGEMN